MPRLLGNLVAGIILKNSIPNGETIYKSVRGLPDYWGTDIITFGLTIIFLRGGPQLRFCVHPVGVYVCNMLTPPHATCLRWLPPSNYIRP